MKVGFIGTGRMGGAMVLRLLGAGHDVGVYNRTAAKVKPLADAGAKILPSIADAARYGDVVFTMLADDAALDRSDDPAMARRSAAEGRHPCLRWHARHPGPSARSRSPRRPGPGPGRRSHDGPAGACHRRHRRRVRLRPRRRDDQVQAAVRGARPQDLRGRRRSGSRHRHEDRQQLRARLRHGGDGRRFRADPQIRRRHRACSTT